MQSERTEEMDSVEVAKQTMIGDLVQATIDELKAAPDVWQKMSEGKQAEVIERVTHRVVHNVTQAIHIIASDDRPTIRANLDQITVKDHVKAVMILSKRDPSALDLMEATGEEVLIVLPHVEEYAGQDVGIDPDPDQPSLGIDDPASGGYGDSGVTHTLDGGTVVQLDGKRLDNVDALEDLDPLLPEAIDFVVGSQKATISSVQRKLKIGYNRAATLIDRMEKLGVISAADGNGRRTVQQQPGNAEGVEGERAEFLPDGFSDVVERVSCLGVFGKAVLEDYDGNQAREIEKALIEEEIIAKDHYKGAHMVLADLPTDIPETCLQRAERLVVQTQDASAWNVGNVGLNTTAEAELLLVALEAKGIVSQPDASGKRTVIVGGES